MTRRRGLGSGLDALIRGDTPAVQGIQTIAIGMIRPNRSQPRVYFPEQALNELAQSIREHGIIQPLIVISHGEDEYELVAGERRWRAAQLAGLDAVPVLIKDATPQQLLELALVENVQRADLNPLEEGQAYQTLKDEFGLTDDIIAERVGKSRVAVVNARRLLKLGHAARQALLDNQISAGHGRALLRIESPEDQAALLESIIQRGLSVREAEQLADLVAQDSLQAATRAALLAGVIDGNQAMLLAQLADATLQQQAVEIVVNAGLSSAETDALCRALAAGKSPAEAADELENASASSPMSAATSASTRSVERSAETARSHPRSAEDTQVESMFEELLNTPVQLVRRGSAIRVVITVFNDEQLQGLYDLLNSQAEA